MQLPKLLHAQISKSQTADLCRKRAELCCDLLNKGIDEEGEIDGIHIFCKVLAVKTDEIWTIFFILQQTKIRRYVQLLVNSEYVNTFSVNGCDPASPHLKHRNPFNQADASKRKLRTY